ALTILLQTLDSFSGYLIGIDDDAHNVLAALPEDEMPEGLKRWFKDYLAQELDSDSSMDKTQRAATGGKSRSNKRSVPYRYADGRGGAFEPLFLTKPEGPNQRLAAVLIYQAAADTRRRPSRELQQELAEQLLEHGDVTGVVLEATGTQTRTR